jgi:hypothetical protein
MTQWLLIQILALFQNHPYAVLGFLVFLLASHWTVFAKAGQPGWAVLIPIYGQIVHARVAGKPWWMGLLLFFPIINVLAMFALSMSIARRFGRGPLFGLGLTFASPIFVPILAFSSSRYRLHG